MFFMFQTISWSAFFLGQWRKTGIIILFAGKKITFNILNYQAFLC